MCMLFKYLMILTLLCSFQCEKHNWQNINNGNLHLNNIVYKFPTLKICQPQTMNIDTRLPTQTETVSSRTSSDVEPQKVSCNANFNEKFFKNRNNIQCKLRPTVVDLSTPQGLTISPNTVVVKRCGGMCTEFKQCLSTGTRNVTKYVKSVIDAGVICNKISVPEDTACKCGCSEKTCDEPKKFNKYRCTCDCPKVPTSCENELKIWDESTCECRCKRILQCSSGTKWNNNKCRCDIIKNNFYTNNYV